LSAAVALRLKIAHGLNEGFSQKHALKPFADALRYRRVVHRRAEPYRGRSGRSSNSGQASMSDICFSRAPKGLERCRRALVIEPRPSPSVLRSLGQTDGIQINRAVKLIHVSPLVSAYKSAPAGTTTCCAICAGGAWRAPH
jgi:hypothetical protein